MKKSMMTILAAMMVILTACGSEVENPNEIYFHADIEVENNGCPKGYVLKQGSCMPQCNPEGTKEELEDGTCICYTPFTGEACNKCNRNTWFYEINESLQKLWKLEGWGTEVVEKIPNTNMQNFDIMETNSCTTRAFLYFNPSSIPSKYDAKFNKEFEIISIQPLYYTLGNYIQLDKEWPYPRYNWQTAQTVCPKSWRLPTLEEAVSVAKDHDLKLSEYWTAAQDEKDASNAYSLHYNKEDNSLQIHSENKDNYNGVICVINNI